MITKSIVLIVLVTFANYVSPKTRRHYRQRLQQAPCYGNIPGLQSIYAEPKSLYPGFCELKQSIILDTPSNIDTPWCPNEQLILPPRSVQLPFGLGYSYAAIPAVAEAYSEKLFDNNVEVQVSEALIPVSPEFANIKIACPFCSEWSCYVKSIVL